MISEPKVEELNHIALKQKVEELELNKNTKIPCIIIRWLENPNTFSALSEKVYEYNRNCIHILLEKGLTSSEKAFVAGFCMGNNDKINWIHVLAFKTFAFCFCYDNYRFKFRHLYGYNLGFNYGRSLNIKNINEIDFLSIDHYPVKQVRERLEIKKYSLEETAVLLNSTKYRFLYHTSYQKSGSELLKWSSSIFALIGGFTLALNVKISPYGFIALAMSSSQLLISSLIKKDLSMIVYSGSVFICVDTFAIYRWLLAN